MKRLAKVLVFLISVAAAYWFLVPKPVSLTSPDVWVGDEESGCMYPVSAIMDGKDPVWWSQNQRRWNQFESKQAAEAAGYRVCP
jgi:uncharacterized membrane protein